MSDITNTDSGEEKEQTEEANAEESEEETSEDEGEEQAEQTEEDREQAQEQTAPPGLGSDQIAAMFADPAAVQAMTAGFQNMMTALRGEEEAAKEVEELGQLVESGNFEELGKRYANQYQQSQQAARVAAQVRNQFYTGLFGGVAQRLPELKNLTDEDKKALDPSNYKSDEDYLAGLFGLVADKRSAASAQSQVHKLLEALGKAGKSRKAAEANEEAKSAPHTPGAAGGKTSPAGSGSQLLNTAYSGEENEE